MNAITKAVGDLKPGDVWKEGTRRVRLIERYPHPMFASQVELVVEDISTGKRDSFSLYRDNHRGVED